MRRAELGRNKRLRGSEVRPQATVARCGMQALLQGVAEGWVRPHVDETFPLAQAGEAQAYIEARRNTGKVVLTA